MRILNGLPHPPKRDKFDVEPTVEKVFIFRGEQVGLNPLHFHRTPIFQPTVPFCQMPEEGADHPLRRNCQKDEELGGAIRIWRCLIRLRVITAVSQKPNFSPTLPLVSPHETE